MMIPKKIHYCWFGGKPLNDLSRKCIESWKKYCPDYEIIEWNEGNVDLDSSPYMKEAYESGTMGFVPDVARLQIIYNHGGIYLDTDVEICRPLDELLVLSAFCGFESKKYVNLGIGFAAEKNHPIIKAFLDDYVGRHFRNADGSLNRKPSPYIQTETLKKLGLKQNNKK